MIAPYESIHVDLGGAPVHVADYGGDGPPVVCVHGLGGSHVNWISVAGGLARLGRVTALDFPGFGLSPCGANACSMDGHRGILDSYLRTLAQPAILVANSMGGAIAILQAAAAPETVRAMILVSPASPRAPGVWPDGEVTGLFSLYLVPGFARAAVAARRTAMTPAEIARWTLDLCAARSSRLPPDVVAAHVEVAIQRTRLPGVDRALVRSARSLLTLMGRKRVFDRAVAAVTAPTYLIQGRADRLVPYHSALRLGAIRPDWEVRILEDVGHIAMLEVPATFVHLVEDWLGESLAA